MQPSGGMSYGFLVLERTPSCGEARAALCSISIIFFLPEFSLPLVTSHQCRISGHVLSKREKYLLSVDFLFSEIANPWIRIHLQFQFLGVGLSNQTKLDVMFLVVCLAN